MLEPHGSFQALLTLGFLGIDFRLGSQLHARQQGNRVVLDAIEHRGKQLAMLLLVLAGATAAAIPDVRRALETTISRVAAIFGAGQAREAAVPIEPVPAEPLDEPEESESFVAPANGRVQILLHAPTGRLDVVVRLNDGEQAQVLTRTVDGPVRRRIGTGRLELMNLGAGAVTIGVPRGVTSATVEIDGEIAVYKQGTTLRGAGPEAETRGTEVRFTTGS
jgi:hypothetical protein